MKVLVTGASGFLGRVLVERLAARAYVVRALVRPTSRVDFLRRLGVELCYGDLADRESLKRSARGVEIIFHTAARVGAWGNRQQFYETNVRGTHHVLEALRAARVPRLVYISSVYVYDRQKGIIDENAPYFKGRDPYSRSKMEAEALAQEYARRHRFALTVLRPSLIYGPHDHKFVPRVTANILKGRMRIIGSGENVAPLVYGEDVADGAILAAESEAAAGEVFNVSSGEPVTWNQFLTTLAQQLGTRLPRMRIPVPVIYGLAAVLEALWKITKAQEPPPATRYGVRLYAADGRYDITRAARLLGYRAKVFHEEGLRRTLDWMRAERLIAPGRSV